MLLNKHFTYISFPFGVSTSTLSCLLEYKYGQRSDIKARLKKIESCKHSIARIFGLGKSSKAKPGPLLEHSRELYDNIAAELNDAQNIDFIETEDEDFTENVSSVAENFTEEKPAEASSSFSLDLDDFPSFSDDNISIDDMSFDDLPDFSMDDFK